MIEMEQLTKRQKAVYEFIRDKIRNRGYGPTVREIGETFRYRLAQRRDVPSQGLEKKGLITPRAEYVACHSTGPTTKKACRFRAAWPPV